MAELAPGVIAVEDVSGECDALFDTERWEYTHPEVWERPPESESPTLNAMGIDALEGLGSVPHVTTIEGMNEMARRHLSPKSGNTWHDSPQKFDFAV